MKLVYWFKRGFKKALMLVVVMVLLAGTGPGMAGQILPIPDFTLYVVSGTRDLSSCPVKKVGWEKADGTEKNDRYYSMQTWHKLPYPSPWFFLTQVDSKTGNTLRMWFDSDGDGIPGWSSDKYEEYLVRFKVDDICEIVKEVK